MLCVYLKSWYIARACDEGWGRCRKEGRLGFDIFDLVPVTQFSKDHKLKMLEDAGRLLIKK